MTKQRCSTCGTEDDPVVIKINQPTKSCHCTTSSTTPHPEKVVAPFPFKENTKTTCVVASVSPSKEKTVYSEGSESMLSVVDINDKLPVLIAREHGPHCALEVSVLEKHAEGCSRRKIDRGGRNPLDDRVGSYDVVGRMVYRTCDGGAGHGDAIKNSAKGFKLNDPVWFGKDLKEKRSRVETLPILPNYDNCILRMQPTPSKKTNTPKAIFAKDEPTVKPVCAEPSRPPKFSKDNLEVLSVYIRTDKSEKVPSGFQKMHYRGDSCKLHDPTERSKQILALQKVIDETSSGAEISKSTKTFHQERETQVMTAAVSSPVNMPKTLYPPVSMNESEESIGTRRISRGSKKIDTDLYNESIEVLPQQHRKYSFPPEDNSSAGLFGCFKKNKPKRQHTDTLSYEDRGSSGSKRVTHSENQPRRHSDSPSHGSPSPRRYSPAYSQRHY